MNAMSILRGLEQQAARESTPIFDRLMAECGSLLDEAPWQPELLTFTPWSQQGQPADYELPPMPIRVAMDRVKRLISSRFATQQMEVIGNG